VEELTLAALPDRPRQTQADPQHDELLVGAVDVMLALAALERQRQRLGQGHRLLEQGPTQRIGGAGEVLVQP